MKLILLGGVQGVGKTTLLSWLENKFAEKITLLNPGELFRRYFYNERIKTIEEIEELIANKLEKMPNDSVVVVYWHYAVRRLSKYIPQINFSRLQRITESGKIEQVILFLVEAPATVVLERRLRDRRIKKRGISHSTINKEVAAEEKFWAKHKALFSRILGNRRVTAFRLTNISLRITKLRLSKLFEMLLF